MARFAGLFGLALLFTTAYGFDDYLEPKQNSSGDYVAVKRSDGLPDALKGVVEFGEGDYEL